MTNRFQPKNLALFLTILLLFALVIWGNSIVEPTMITPGENLDYQYNQVIYQTPIPTPIPGEIEKNRSQTMGVIGGVIVLVTIIVVGTLNGIKRK